MLNRLAILRSSVLQRAKQYCVGILVSIAVCLISLSFYFAIYIVSHPSPLLQFLADA